MACVYALLHIKVENKHGNRANSLRVDEETRNVHSNMISSRNMTLQYHNKLDDSEKPKRGCKRTGERDLDRFHSYDKSIQKTYVVTGRTSLRSTTGVMCVFSVCVSFITYLILAKETSQLGLMQQNNAV